MVKIIYSPEKDFPKGGIHPLRYCRPVNRPKRANAKATSNEELELVGILLVVGVNDLSGEDADFILKHPSTTARLYSGAIEVLEPAVKENLSGTLADYSLADAKKIISNTYDLEALSHIPTEDRRPEIIKWVRDRKNDLQKADLAAISGDS